MVGLIVALTPPVVPGLTVVMGLTFAVGALVADGLAENDGNRLIVGTGVLGWLLFRVHPAKAATKTAINMIAIISFFIQFASFSYILYGLRTNYFTKNILQGKKKMPCISKALSLIVCGYCVLVTDVLTDGLTEGAAGDTVGLKGSVVGLTVAVGFTLVVGFVVVVIVFVG